MPEMPVSKYYRAFISIKLKAFIDLAVNVVYSPFDTAPEATEDYFSVLRNYTTCLSRRVRKVFGNTAAPIQ